VARRAERERSDCGRGGEEQGRLGRDRILGGRTPRRQGQQQEQNPDGGARGHGGTPPGASPELIPLYPPGRHRAAAEGHRSIPCPRRNFKGNRPYSVLRNAISARRSSAPRSSPNVWPFTARLVTPASLYPVGT